MSFIPKKELEALRKEKHLADRAAKAAADSEQWAQERRSTAEAALEEAQAEIVDLNATISLKNGRINTLQAELDTLLSDRTLNIRLEVLKHGGWSNLEDIDIRAAWVLDGILPERLTSDEGAKDVVTEKSEGMAMPMTIPVPPGGFESTVAALEYVAEKLEQVRLDPQLSVGKVRLQRIAARLDYAIAEVRDVLGLPAEERL